MFLLRHIFPKALFMNVMQNILANRFTPDELEKIKRQYHKHHRQLLREHLTYGSAGVRLMQKLARKNLALYRTLLDHSVKKEEAFFYLESIQCELTRDLASVIYGLSGMVYRDALKRLEWMDQLLWKFLFTHPFLRTAYAMDDNRIAFKVIRCPVAEYFQAYNQCELCTRAFCNLYYHWADTAHVTLDRGLTLASGASHCHFQFQINSTDCGET